MDEEEFKKAVATGLVPNRYDLLKIIGIAVLLLMVFGWGYLYSMAQDYTHTCQLYVKSIMYNTTIIYKANDSNFTIIEVSEG